MRRWNGWGDEKTNFHVPEAAWPWLEERVGAAASSPDTPFTTFTQAVPPSPLPAHPLITTEAKERVLHARGQSLPDWVDLRRGRVPRFPAGVAYPESDDDLASLIRYAKENSVTLIPYGGGTSVVGGINPEKDGPPALTVNLSRLNQLHDLNEQNRLATFGAGIAGPDLEKALNQRGYTLGHFPQSFELSTLGGWIAARSSGQQSLHYGRIEQTFAGGRIITPAGILDMLPHPASAAGPDLRQMVLGSEGRMGFISRATVRITPLPEEETFHGIFFPTWEQGVAAVRAIAQAQLPLSMMRLSNPLETEANLVLAGKAGQIAWLHRGLGWLGQRPGEKCLLLMGVTGAAAANRLARRSALHLARQGSGVHLGQFIGRSWQKNRFITPYLRNNLWERGIAVDTLETVLSWDKVLPAAEAIIGAIRERGAAANEKILVLAHLSHVYPSGTSLYVTYLFRVLPDPEQQIEQWWAMKAAASQALIQFGGTISHQHGVGVDHAPFLGAEKGELGLDLLAQTFRHCDPDGLMNPGKLIRSASGR